MKRILALILTILMVTLAFTSCVVTEPKETEKETEKQSETEKETENSSDNELNGEKESEESKETETQKSDEGKESETGNSSQNSGETSQKAYTRDGKKITFGSYPQTEVTDATLIATLNTKAGTLPSSENKQAWTSYGYYISGNNDTDYTWYIDITEGGEKYRGVYFTSYRPYYTYDSSSESNSNQDENDYIIGTIYWFKYDPIIWTILSESTTGRTALILCDMIIDSQEYYINDNNRDIDGETIYPNNYAHSAIRQWLNDTFYETAFNELQQTLILTTTIDNSMESTGHSKEDFECENTQDKIFLLSYNETTNSDYGFNADYLEFDTARQKKTTDYAQAQGAWAWTSTSTDYVGNGCWWLRSPGESYSYSTLGVYLSGCIHNGHTVCSASHGVVPALQIKLS